VRELYIRLIEDPLEAEERIVVIDGNRSLQEVHENIRVLVGDMMPAAAR
jgi:thymidylate kinase